MDTAMQAIGLFGAVLLIIAYYQVSNQQISTESNGFQGLNFIGAVLLALSSVYFSAYGPALLNLFWMIIACVKLIAINKKKP